ncbi:hypothetical protein ETAA8_15580 [Anatilimnocola aggregata]|uniref:Carboxypeptidase regulatory-like domain-containing protein n=1 Tax=Anatilimnocola aggregata TaxID=2528021 RepID=A0A517Y8B8_9BACT|nr:carboxypeptidase-like regulatory domain-containing protein [Anatilimnocola aggregata]QDU26480.1 hypothetical protein ETAA8_15580 [Anatilimnocola aggregata]
MIRTSIVTLALSFVAGCAPTGPAAIPVTGVVTLDGQPCASAVVNLVAHGETTGNGGWGRTDEQGKFVIHLNDGRSEQGPPGLPAGQYKVLISKLVTPDGQPFIPTEDVAPIDSNAKELLPPIYSDFQQTTLTADVVAPKSELVFELKSARR